MKRVTRLAIVDPNDLTRAQLRDLVVGMDTMWLDAECSRYEFFSDVLLQSQPDIAIVSLDADPDKALAVLARLSQDVPAVSLLAASKNQEGSLILQAMRNGAREFLTLPLKLDDLLASLHRIEQSSPQGKSDGKVRSSQVIAVTGVSGGVGCTSLATNVACILAKDPEKSVTLIDLDLTLGDADVWLDIISEYTVQDVVANITRLDYSLLKRSLARHASGMFLLPRPASIDNLSSFTADELRRVLSLLKATFSHIVIDTSKGFTPLDVAAMEAADDVLVVTQLDLGCLRNLVRLLQVFDNNDLIAGKAKIIVNRVGRDDSQISLNKALETIGREVFWQLPNDYMTMVESRNNGSPLIIEAPRSKIYKAIEQLVGAICETSEEATEDAEAAKNPKKKPGLFSFLGGAKN